MNDIQQAVELLKEAGFTFSIIDPGLKADLISEIGGPERPAHVGRDAPILEPEITSSENTGDDSKTGAGFLNVTRPAPRDGGKSSLSFRKETRDVGPAGKKTSK